MRIARWLELISGLAAGVVGLAIIAFTLFGPVYSTASSDPSSCTYSPAGTTCTGSVYGTATMAQVNGGIPPLALLYFSALAVLLLGLIACTLLHWRLGSHPWRWLLWIVTGLLALVALAGFDLFVLMAPSVLLALVAALAARNNRPVAAA
jgi:hypothetical protein